MVPVTPSRPLPIPRRLALAAVALLAGLAPALAWSSPASAEECADLGDTEERFVCYSYQSFVRRFPTFDELTYWEVRMPARRTVFLATLGKSEASRREIIEASYDVYSDHAPSAAEVAYWLPEVLKPNGYRRLQAGLLGAYVGTLDGYLDTIFHTLLNRSPNNAERDYWGTRAQQTSKTLTAADLIYTLESRRKVVVWSYYNEMFVDVDSASRDYWAERLRTGTSYLEMRIQLKTSDYPDGSGLCSSPTPPVRPTAGCET